MPRIEGSPQGPQGPSFRQQMWENFKGYSTVTKVAVVAGLLLCGLSIAVMALHTWCQKTPEDLTPTDHKSEDVAYRTLTPPSSPRAESATATDSSAGAREMKKTHSILEKTYPQNELKPEVLAKQLEEIININDPELNNIKRLPKILNECKSALEEYTKTNDSKIVRSIFSSYTNNRCGFSFLIYTVQWLIEKGEVDPATSANYQKALEVIGKLRAFASSIPQETPPIQKSAPARQASTQQKSEALNFARELRPIVEQREEGQLFQTSLALLKNLCSALETYGETGDVRSQIPGGSSVQETFNRALGGHGNLREIIKALQKSPSPGDQQLIDCGKKILTFLDRVKSE